MQGMIRMVTRLAIRQAVNIGIRFGIDRGVDHMVKRGHGSDEPLTGAQRKQAGHSKRRMRETMRLIRRIGRF